jgi:hypothetical protein
MRPRNASALVATLLTGAAAGCGGGDDASPTEAVQDVATKYFRAAERGDSKATCALASKERLAEYGGRDACEAEEKHDPLPADAKAKLSFHDVTVSGDTAKLVEVNDDAATRTYDFVREDGGWKIRRVGVYRAIRQP